MSGVKLYFEKELVKEVVKRLINVGVIPNAVVVDEIPSLEDVQANATELYVIDAGRNGLDYKGLPNVLVLGCTAEDGDLVKPVTVSDLLKAIKEKEKELESVESEIKSKSVATTTEEALVATGEELSTPSATLPEAVAEAKVEIPSETNAPVSAEAGLNEREMIKGELTEEASVQTNARPMVAQPPVPSFVTDGEKQTTRAEQFSQVSEEKVKAVVKSFSESEIKEVIKEVLISELGREVFLEIVYEMIPIVLEEKINEVVNEVVKKYIIP